MKRAIRAHLRDFIAILGLAAIGIGTAAYILSHERLRFPVVEEEPFRLKAEFPNAQGVMPGQGQTVRVAGMKVGDIGKVDLEDGKAVVRMDLEPEHDKLVHRDARVLLRPRTPLKDMFIALDPGSSSEPLLRENDVIKIENALPDVNPDEVLSALDADTRDYLRLLINGAGKGLRGRGGDLREVFRRLGPLQRDVGKLTKKVAERRRNLARLIHNYGRTITRLGEEDESLARLVRNARTVFTNLAREDGNISEAVSRLPSTLRRTEAALTQVNRLGQVAGPAFEALRPAVRELDDANAASLPLARDGEPILRRQVRPFVRVARPYVAELEPTAKNLAKASPDLRESFLELNRFFNMAAYNPNGRERLTGNATTDAQRDEGLLHWLGWVAQNTTSIFNTSDASGPFRRLIIQASCSTYLLLQKENDAMKTFVDFLAPFTKDPNLCPPE